MLRNPKSICGVTGAALLIAFGWWLTSRHRLAWETRGVPPFPVNPPDLSAVAGIVVQSGDGAFWLDAADQIGGLRAAAFSEAPLGDGSEKRFWRVYETGDYAALITTYDEMGEGLHELIYYDPSPIHALIHGRAYVYSRGEYRFFPVGRRWRRWLSGTLTADSRVYLRRLEVDPQVTAASVVEAARDRRLPIRTAVWAHARCRNSYGLTVTARAERDTDLAGPLARAQAEAESALAAKAAAASRVLPVAPVQPGSVLFRWGIERGGDVVVEARAYLQFPVDAGRDDIGMALAEASIEVDEGELHGICAGLASRAVRLLLTAEPNEEDVIALQRQLSRRPAL